MGLVILGPNPNAETGVNVYGGDLDGDGYDDILIGCANATVDGSHYPGATYVVWGGPNLPGLIDLSQPNTKYVSTFLGASDGDQFGTAVAIAGDMNGDGILDFAASSPNNNNGNGAVYIIYGSKTRWSPHSRINVRSIPAGLGYAVYGRTGDVFGFDLSFVGDFNNDGLADVAVGSPGSGTLPGSAMVIFGSRTLFAASVSVSSFDGIKGTVFTGVTAGDLFGDAVGPAGDYNLDGIADLTVGAAGTIGDVYVLYGQAGVYPAFVTVSSSLPTTAGEIIPPPMTNSGIGGEVWGGFDFNGDGKAEVALPLPSEANGSGNVVGALVVRFDLTP